MLLNARTLADGTRLQADVCIVGAGPAGLTVARELINTDLDVLVLESGATEPDDRIRDLNAGTIVGDPWTDLRRTRQRGPGGTTQLWNTPVRGEPGGKYVPLDACDFEARPDHPLSGWPFGLASLEPYYRRAQVVCGLGPFGYEADAAVGAPGFALAGDRVTSRIYQFGQARVFTVAKVDEMRSADNVRLCHSATVCQLVSAGNRITGAHVACPAGPRLTVTAELFVLAAGAIENARLLLHSNAAGDSPAAGWVGRGFMEHPRDYALTLFPSSIERFREAAFYDVHETAAGSLVCGRLALTDLAVREDRLPNASATLLPRVAVKPEPGGVLARFLHRVRLAGMPRPSAGYGWSRTAAPEALYDAFRIILNVEQRPDPENRMVLSRTRDVLGMPLVDLHWAWREPEQNDLIRLRRTIAAALEDAGIGSVDIRDHLRPDPNAHHHSGTTRMHTDPGRGVVDENGRVHGRDNLYLAGASVFPTAGFANPTLTIVALALRLADHIRARAPQRSSLRSGSHS